MEAESTRWELTYCDEIQQIDGIDKITSGNILKVPPNLLSILEKEDIMVEGTLIVIKVKQKISVFLVQGEIVIK